MASFHLSPKSFSRARGQSAIAASAYRSGQELTDERTGQVHDYSRKEGVLHTEIMLPDGAPEWAQNIERLWNEAEAAERRKDAKVAREFEISLPYELPHEQRLELAREFAQEVINRYGVAAQVSLHAPGKEGDPRNWHAHVLTTTRALDEDGFGDKVRVLDSPKTSGEQIQELREKWADMQNKALADAGLDVRVDHRSFKEQGIDRAPQVHLGVHATAMERRGIETERGEINREIVRTREALAEITKSMGDIEQRQNMEQLVAMMVDLKTNFERIKTTTLANPKAIQENTKETLKLEEQHYGFENFANARNLSEHHLRGLSECSLAYYGEGQAPGVLSRDAGAGRRGHEGVRREVPATVAVIDSTKDTDKLAAKLARPDIFEREATRLGRGKVRETVDRLAGQFVGPAGRAARSVVRFIVEVADVLIRVQEARARQMQREAAMAARAEQVDQVKPSTAAEVQAVRIEPVVIDRPNGATHVRP